MNSLFDRIITFRLKELNAAWKAINDTEKKLGGKASPAAKKMLAEARRLASTAPITGAESNNPAVMNSFHKLKKGEKAAGRQAEFEEKWDAAALKNYGEAKTLAEKAASAK